MIYLDNNATTQMDPTVVEAMLPYLKEKFGNPSSRHRQGRAARAAIETAREQVASLVSAHPSQVIFTGSGTEASNLAIKGYAAGITPSSLFIGSTEHPSVTSTANKLARFDGWHNLELPVTENGLLSDEAMEKLNTAKPGDLVSVMLANNETGVIQPISDLYRQLGLKDKGIVIHTDAVQAAGKIALNFSALGVHLMTLSAHKIHGPKGMGALIRDKSIVIEPQINGGGHEEGLRSGTENVAAIVGFGAAAELAHDALVQTNEKLLGLRTKLENGLKMIPGIEIIAGKTERLANTSCFTMASVEGETMLMMLDKAGIAIASGSACSSHDSAPSKTLTAMGLDKNRARRALRVSLGKDNTENEIDTFLDTLKMKLASFDNVASNVAI